MLGGKGAGPSRLTGWIAITGLAVGCMAMVLSISVLNGFEKKVTEKIRGFEGDLRIVGITKQANDIVTWLEKEKRVSGSMPFMERKGILVGNNNTLMKEVKKASEVSSEKVWELPLWEEYTREIKGKYADIKNIGEARLAGTITAGAFLKEFVDDTPWVHMDIAGTAWGPKEPSYQPKVGATGVAVRLVYQLLENRILYLLKIK